MMGSGEITINMTQKNKKEKGKNKNVLVSNGYVPHIQHMHVTSYGL